MFYYISVYKFMLFFCVFNYVTYLQLVPGAQEEPVNPWLCVLLLTHTYCSLENSWRYRLLVQAFVMFNCAMCFCPSSYLTDTEDGSKLAGTAVHLSVSHDYMSTRNRYPHCQPHQCQKKITFTFTNNEND